MRYWNDNRKSCEHVEPREDWKESIEKWIDWMDAIGRAYSASAFGSHAG